MWWPDEIEKRTDGRVKCEMFWMHSLIDSREFLEGTGKGIGDLSYAVASYTMGKTPLSNIAYQPALGVDPWALGEAAVEIHNTPELLAEMEPHNVKVIGIWPGGPYPYYGLEPVRTLGDLKGVKCRVTGDQAVLLEALGAVPVSVPTVEAYEALARGTLDGGVMPLSSIIAYKHCEVCKYLTHTPIGYLGHPMIINKDAYNKLPDDVRNTIIPQLAEEMPLEWVRRYSADNEKLLKELVDVWGWEIIDLPPSDMAKIREVAKEVLWDKWVGKMEDKGLPGRKVLDNFLALYAKYELQAPKSYEWVESRFK